MPLGFQMFLACRSTTSSWIVLPCVGLASYLAATLFVNRKHFANTAGSSNLIPNDALIETTRNISRQHDKPSLKPLPQECGMYKGRNESDTFELLPPEAVMKYTGTKVSVTMP